MIRSAKVVQAEKALRRPRLGAAICLTLLALTATGCGLTPTYTPRASDQWSNGKMVGVATLNQQVALQVDQERTSFLVWTGLEHRLNFARLNERAEVVTQEALDLQCTSPLKPQLLMDPTGRLHLTWLDRLDGSLQLFYASLSPDGEVIQGATALSPPEQRLAHVSMILDPVGQTLEVFWSDSAPSRPGSYHAALDWSGSVIVPAEMLISDGLLPAAQIDRQGFVHLAWRVEPEAENPQFRYAVYDPQLRALGPDVLAAEPVAMASVVGRPTAGARFTGPLLGLDEDAAYLAWVFEVYERGGREASTYYRSFPLPALTRPEGAEKLEYAPPEVTGEPVHVQGTDPVMTGDPRFLAGQPKDQVLACDTQVPGRGSTPETLQVVAVELLAGQIEGQEIVNASSAASLHPNIVADPGGALHLAWIDTAGFERYQIIYASTSTEAKETLNRITAYDIVDRVLSTVMYVFSALFFIPMALAWMSVPIVWLVVFSLVTHASEVSDRLGWTGLGLAMLLQVAAKHFFFPDLLAQSPLGSLVSPSLGPFLGRWILPLLLAAVSAGIAWIYLRSRRGQSIFVAYFIYAIVDSLLTLVVYVALPMAG